jgi:hypothetical protein
MQCTGSLTTIRRSPSQSMLHSTNIPIARPAQLSRCWRARSATRVHDRRRASNCLCSKHFSKTRKHAAAQNSRSRSIRDERRDEERRASRMREKTSTPFRGLASERGATRQEMSDDWRALIEIAAYQTGCDSKSPSHAKRRARPKRATKIKRLGSSMPAIFDRLYHELCQARTNSSDSSHSVTCT